MQLKKTLRVIGIILLILFVIGIWVYVEFFRVDPQLENQLKKEFGSAFFVLESQEPAAREAGIAEKTDHTSPISQATLEKLEKLDLQKTEPDNLDNKAVSQETIVKKYLPRFESLEAVSSGRLDALYNSAVQEYHQQKSSGTLDRTVLARKYIQAAGMLEKNVDSSFYSSLNEMKAELQSNNLPTDIVEEIAKEYEKAKASQKRKLLSRVKV